MNFRHFSSKLDFYMRQAKRVKQIYNTNQKQMKKTQIDDQDDQIYILGNEKIQKKSASLIAKIPEDPKYEKIEVKILGWKSQKTITLQTQYFQIQIISKHYDQTWQIQRRYSDFQWLFHALKFSYPGFILPYFPVKTIQNFMATQLNMNYAQEKKNDQFMVRKKELQKFIQEACCQPQLKHAEQLKIFLNSSQEQFKKQKKAIETHIKQSRTQQSSSNSFISIFERGVAWITSSQENQELEKLDDTTNWADIEGNMKEWIHKVITMGEKIKDLIKIKEKQIQWEGPDTEIDSVQHLKAKIISGRQFNLLLIQSLRKEVLESFQYQIKSVKQIEDQLEERQKLIKIILYIKKFTQDENRCAKLLRKKQSFELRMQKDWPTFQNSLKQKMKTSQAVFTKVWKNYCSQINKIWKHSIE